jgi:hypothetical protein
MPLRQMNVSAEWVADGDTGALPTVMGADLEPAQARDLQGTMAFMFPELEVDGVGIFDVPGVVDWLALLHARIPHLVYFLAPQPELGALQGLLLGFMPHEERDAAVAGGFPVTRDMLAQLAYHLTACASFATEKGDDWEPIVADFLEPLGDDTTALLQSVVRDAVDEH